MKTLIKQSEHPQNDEDGHSQYIVTQTIGCMMHSLKANGLKIPSTGKIKGYEESVLRGLQTLFKNKKVKLESVLLEEQCDQITVHVRRAQKQHPKATVISTSPLLVFENDGRCLHISRIVDFIGNIIGIGPRPGHAAIAKQLAQLHESIADQQVIIVEDGSFTGRSLEYILAQLKEHRARVETVILGILFPEAEKRVRKTFSGEIVPCRKFSNPLDWMPSHDFIPFLPNSGRVVGFRMGHNAFPIYLHDGASICMPYILPYGNPVKWAGLPDDQNSIRLFSLSCLHTARDIFSEMEELNGGKPILLDDVLNSQPRTSVPVSPMNNPVDDGPTGGFSETSDRVTALLSLDMELLS